MNITPTLRPLVALSALLILGVLSPLGPGTSVLAQSANDSKVQVVNLSSTDFSVSWFTDAPVTGSIMWGTTCAGATNPGLPESPGDGYVHLVTAIDPNGPGLGAGAPYYFVVQSGSSVDNNFEQCYTVKTPTATNLGTATASGTIVTPPGCATGVLGALVTITVTDSGITSLPLADMSQSDGSWSVPIGAAMDANGNDITLHSGDALDVTVAASSDNTISKPYTYSGNTTESIPNICLPNPLGIPTATPVDVQTPTPTPSPGIFGGTATPTPNLFGGTPTPALTPGTPTATPVLTSTPGTLLPTSTPIVLVPTPSPAAATPIPSATSTATAIPTSTPTPTSTATPLPKRIREASPTPTSRSKHSTPARRGRKPLQPVIFLAYGRVAAGGLESVVVHTRGGSEVLFIVYYPRGSARLTIDARANGEGYWSNTFAVPHQQHGRATVKIVIISEQLSKLIFLHFTVG